MTEKVKKNTNNKHEHFSSRLGFILISAGCAIGLGNVWKFPNEVGQNGGAAFLILYLICTLVLALPLMSFEFAIGRASQHSNAKAYNTLEPKGSKWHIFKWFSTIGQYILMFFYTTVCGWMLDYILKEATNSFEDATSTLTAQIFNDMISNPYELVFWMFITCLIGMLICCGGVQKGIEKVTKVMMLVLLALMLVLAVFSVLQPGAQAGIEFYLLPDFNKIFATPQTFMHVLYSAMSLAFFTMSVGMGSMVIFGSYINKDRALFGEAITIGSLNIGVAIIAGLIIFPACFSFGVSPDAGPSLVFETLPNVFSNLPCGHIMGTLFFVFLSFAALSTVVAVFENLVAFWIEEKGWSRKRSITINFFIIIIGSIPCCLGFNVWSNFGIPALGIDSILGLEDFIISNNLLPLGGIIIVAFCTFKKGWGWKNAVKEINTGVGIKYPAKLKFWASIVIPILIIMIFIIGWLVALQ